MAQHVYDKHLLNSSSTSGGYGSVSPYSPVIPRPQYRSHTLQAVQDSPHYAQRSTVYMPPVRTHNILQGLTTPRGVSTSTSADTAFATIFPFAASLLSSPGLVADEYDSFMNDEEVSLPERVEGYQAPVFSNSILQSGGFTSYEHNSEVQKGYDAISLSSVGGVENTQNLSNMTDWYQPDHVRPEEEWFYEHVEEFVANSQSEAVDSGLGFGQHMSLDLVNKFADMCEQRVQELGKIQAMYTNSATQKLKEHTTALLTAEKNTWHLIYDLYIDRSSDSMQEVLMGVPLSQVQVVKKLFLENRSLREIKVVCKWLEAIAEGTVNYNICKVVNLHTVQQLQSGSNSPALVTEVDPDGPSRQSRSLNPDDKNYEEHFLKTLWCFIQSGKLEQAQELCIQCGQPWRAVSIGGHALYEDIDNSGNQYRNIWKESCRAISQDKLASKYEQAIYGILSQNLDAVLPLCHTWEEYMWANLKVLLATVIDETLAICAHPFGGDVPKIAPSLSADMTIQDVITSMKTHSKPEIRRGSQEKYHQIQERIILGDIEGLFKLLATWATMYIDDNTPNSGVAFSKSKSATTGSISPELMRFAAHTLVFFRNKVPEATQSISADYEVVLSAYIQHLIKSRKYHLVARYTAFLSPSSQEMVYANFLKEITDSAEIQTCLALGERAGLNVKKIASKVVELKTTAAESIPPQLPTMSEGELADSDKLKISSLEYLCWDPAQRPEALMQANTLIREFTLNGKLEAARNVMDILPKDTRTVIMERISEGDKTVKNNAIREYMGFECLLRAHFTYNAWKFHHYKRPEPPIPPMGNTVPEQIDYENRLKVYNEKTFIVWQEKDTINSEAANREILKVLQFENGWMLDFDSVRFESVADNERKNQMLRIRRKCIPELCFMMYTILFSTGKYQPSLDMAALVADEHYMLYTTFKQEEMQKLVALFHQSTLALLKPSP